MSEQLTPDQLAAHRKQMEAPRARNPYVTDYGVAADVVSDLLDHIEARELAFKEGLRALRQPMRQDQSGYGVGSNDATAHHNMRVTNLASRLNINLDE